MNIYKSCHDRICFFDLTLIRKLKLYLIFLISGQLELASGSVRVGETARIGYYEQTGLVLTDEQVDT